MSGFGNIRSKKNPRIEKGIFEEKEVEEEEEGGESQNPNVHFLILRYRLAKKKSFFSNHELGRTQPQQPAAEA